MSICNHSIWNCNSHLHKYFYFINFVPSAYIIRTSPRVMYKHRNKQECCKKQMLIYTVHLLDKYNKILLKCMVHK